MQKGIRIRERYLTALEEERWELLPGEAYAKGFLRTYAEFLGLDGNLYVEEFNARVARHEDELLVPESLTVSHRARRGMVRTLLGLVVLASVVAGVAAWGSSGSAGDGAGAKIPAPARVAAGRTLRVVQALPVVGATPVAKAAPPAYRAVVSAARGRCWLAVRTGGPGGPLLYQGILERGRTLRFAVGASLWMRMGRPRALEIVLGGRRVHGLPARPANVLLTRRGPQAA